MLNPLFLSCTFIFLLNRLSEYYVFYVALINSYLDDLMLVPIILGLALAAMRLIIHASYRFSLWQCIMSTPPFCGDSTTTTALASPAMILFRKGKFSFSAFSS